MTNRSDRGSAKPKGSQRFERDDVIREPACGLIRASSHTVLREQAEHMDAPDRCSSLHKALAPQGSSTHGQPWAEHTAYRKLKPAPE